MILTPKRQKEREEELKKIKDYESSPWVFLIRKNRLTYLIIAFLLIFGILTIQRLPRELQPEVKIPIAVVSTAFPGASPLDVEQQVTKEIEKRVANIDGIKTIDSTSSIGFSSIVVEFEADEDIDKSIDKLKDEVDVAKNDLPEDATDPVTTEISFDDQAIFTAVLVGERYDISELKLFAEDIKDKLEGISFVSEVRVIGGRDEVIKIDIDEQKAKDKGLTAVSIIGALDANNIDFPAGSVEIDGSAYSVRTSGEFKTAEQVAKLPVGNAGSASGSSAGYKPILLEDVAEVRKGFAKELSKSRFAKAGDKTTDAVSIQLFKKTGGDITEISATAKQIVENGKGTLYPEDVQAAVIIDLSTFITDSINDLLRNGLATVIIILLLLFFFLGWKEALIAGLSVPFSFFIAFIMMALFGVSLNFLSLFSLVLALGLLVDSAIVIVEGMYAKIARLRLSGYQAAIGTVREFSAPLLSGMLTTVAAFFPLMFVRGILGEFMRTIPIVVNITLIAALFVALTIVPAIGAISMGRKKKERVEELEKCDPKEVGYSTWMWGVVRHRCKPKPRNQRISHKLFKNLSWRYYQVLPKIIERKKIRRLLIGGAWAAFAIALLLPIAGLLKITAFGTTDSEFFYVNIEMPNGTVLEETDVMVKKAESILLKESQILDLTSSVGSGASFTIGAGSGSASNRAFMYANLTKKEDRKETSGEIVARIRPELEKELSGAKVSFLEEESGPPSGAPVELRVLGDDLIQLENTAEEIKRKLETIPTVVNAETSVDFSPGEFVFVPNKDILAQKGLSVAQVALELNKGISRDQDIEISQQGEEIELDVGYDEKQLNSINDLEAIRMITLSGEELAISELGRVLINPSLAKIDRRDEERAVTVTADTEGGNPTEITTQLMEEIEKTNLPEGVSISFGGEQQELQEILQDMLLKMIIGVILIFFVLIIQFNSYKQVMIILFTIPLAMVGVFFGMTVGRLTLDVPAFVGIVSLIGIVVNNAIILIDRINKELAKGKRLVQSVRRAGFVRFRPIILTSITTIVGLLPLSITQPDWRNMGFAIIFGLLFSSVLTLFVIPTMFVSFYRKQIK